MKKLIIFTALLALTGCTAKFYPSFTPESHLVSIHIIDRENMTEVISNSERLKNYESVDFFRPQPYQRVLRVFSRHSDGSIPAFITSYHPNGQIKQYLEVINNRANGCYKEWYSNGNLKVEATLIEGNSDLTPTAQKSWIFDGFTLAYGEDGELLARIPYQRGSLEGSAFYFHLNGSIWKEIPYNNNLLSGEMRVFLDNGELFQSSNYSNNLKHGKSVRFWPSGLIAAEEWYEKGLLLKGIYRLPDECSVSEINDGHGFRALFSKNRLSELHEYHWGLPEGEVQAFDMNRKLVKVHHVKNGLKHGEELFYYPSLADKPVQSKLLIPWFEGKVQGISKTWYDNGVQESQKELSNNKRNGVSTAWYRNGQLMLIEEYEQDKLRKGDYFRKGDRQPVSQVINGEGIVTYFDSEGSFVRKAHYRNGKPDE